MCKRQKHEGILHHHHHHHCYLVLQDHVLFICDPIDGPSIAINHT